jgi:hypothetical protein
VSIFAAAYLLRFGCTMHPRFLGFFAWIWWWIFHYFWQFLPYMTVANLLAIPANEK